MPKKGASRRVISLALALIVTILMLGPVFAKPLLASSSQIPIVERPEEELLILELHINKKIRNRGFLAYLPEASAPSQSLIPLRALSKDLSVNINVDPSAGRAQGWFIEQSNVIQLDLNRQIALIKGKEIPIPPGGAEAHYDDIYIRAPLIADWLDLDIDFDIGSLRMFVTSETTLPFEAELEREERAEALKKRALTQAPEYDDSQFLPYKNFSLPSLILQDSIVARTDNNSSTFQNSYSIQSLGDLGGFGTRFLLSGTAQTQNGHRVDNARLTFRKRDPGQNLLGPLKAGSIAFGDVDYPDVPLFAGRRNGFGLSISSNPQLAVSRSFGPETTIIDGDAPIGWDAELYRNGFFIDFQEVGNEGRFSFEDVELIQGFNLFSIILYGPEGQKQTQTQRIVRGAQILREGEVSYEFAAGQPEADFLPISENRQTDRTFGASGQIFYGFKEYLTLGASVFSGSDRTSTLESTEKAATVSAIVPFLGFRNQFRLLRASEGRSGYDIETSTRIAGTSISLGHRDFEGFDEDDQNIKTITTLAANKNFGPFSMNFQAEDRSFVDDIDEDEIFLRSTISTRLFGTELTNSLERTLSDDKTQQTFEGDLSLLFDIGDWRLRNNLRYDLDSKSNERLENYRLSAVKKIDRDRSLRINGDYNFASNTTQADARYSQNFDKFSIDLIAGATSNNNYSAGVTLRTALQPNHDGKYNFVNARDGGLGAIGIRTYLDKNANNKYDEGEDLLEGIGFRSNRGLIEDRTNSQGTVFVRGLSESATRFSLDDSSLPSIYLKPNVDYVDIFPRGGATTTIDVGFSQLGEIDGFIYRPETDEDGKPIPATGVSIRIINLNTGEEIDETTSEYDGYYIFTPLDLAPYRVQVLPLWSEDPETMPYLDINLTSDNAVQTDHNITLSNPNAPIPLTQTTLAPTHTLEPTHPTQKQAQAATPKTGHFIQIGSYKNQQSAHNEKARMMATHHDLFKENPFEIHTAQVNNDLFYRVVSRVKTHKAGKTLCQSLKEKKITPACIVSTN